VTTFYHGTRAGFRRGGYLFPVDFHGKEARPGHVEGGTAWVYFTTDRETAEWYAFQAKGRGRAKVLTVEPMGAVLVDPSTFDYEEDQYRCEMARVVAVDMLECHA
jgi:hypothetical protein